METYEKINLADYFQAAASVFSSDIMSGYNPDALFHSRSHIGYEVTKNSRKSRGKSTVR